ncbi:MAG: hypothetical protein L0H75_04035 [Nitrosospira sp.]|nr:hypothetical protein [Nitrosospira sp.]
MAQTLAIGHDKRGNVIYKRNDEGEEILFPSEGEEAELFEFDARGDATKRVLRPTKQVDDDAPIVAAEFIDWKKTAVLGW